MRHAGHGIKTDVVGTSVLFKCPPRLAELLSGHRGDLPVTFEYRSKEGLLARVKASAELRLKHDPNLAERLARETGCALTWTY